MNKRENNTGRRSYDKSHREAMELPPVFYGRRKKDRSPKHKPVSVSVVVLSAILVLLICVSAILSGCVSSGHHRQEVARLKRSADECTADLLELVARMGAEGTLPSIQEGVTETKEGMYGRPQQ